MTDGGRHRLNSEDNPADRNIRMKAFPVAFSVAFLGALISMFTVTAHAGDVAAGKARSETCLGCHGVPSYTTVYPTYHVPKLAGQHAPYLVSALKAYQQGMRKHHTMSAQAHTLSEQEINDVAAYFASLESAPADPEKSVPDHLAEKVGICAACHGADGSSPITEFPRIGGQHRDYLYHSLKQYKAGTRQNPIMLGIAELLSDEDMQALSKYFSRQPGLGRLGDTQFLEK